MPPRTPAPRGLVLGAAVGYSWEHVRPFVQSLRASGSDADVVLLTGRIDATMRESLARFRIRALPVQRLLQRMPPALARKRFNRPRLGWLHRAVARRCERWPAVWGLRLATHVGPWFQHIACSRYAHYLRYLRRHAGDYTGVLLSDVRDVVFQADPFARAPAPDELWVFLEHAATHGADEGNDRWVETGFGAEGRAALLGRRVTCSGVTIGGTAAMLRYLEAMVMTLAARVDLLVGLDGVDQGVHNWLFWTNRLPFAQAMQNFRGPVLTMHGMPGDAFRRDASGRLLDAEGAVIPVVHQYDRHPELAAPLLDALGIAPSSS